MEQANGIDKNLDKLTVITMSEKRPDTKAYVHTFQLT